MEIGTSKTLWEIFDVVVALIPEETPKKRGTYKKATIKLRFQFPSRYINLVVIRQLTNVS